MNKFPFARFFNNGPLFYPDGGGAGGGEGDKTFTQADLDRIVGERLTREREKYKDYDTYKEKAGKYDESEANKLSEQEKLKKERDEANEKSTAALTTANKRLVTAELKLQAAAQGVPADRLAAVTKLTDLSSVNVDDNGDVSGVKEAIEACLKANAFLLAGVAGGSNLEGNPAGNKGAQVNPWKKETFNLTQQAKLIKENLDMAKTMAAAAGVKLEI